MAESVSQTKHASNNRIGIIAAVVAVLLIAGWGVFSRLQARADLRRRAAEETIPTVALISLKAGAPTEDLVLPGSVEAIADAPIYARTSGYLKRWLVDIGANVKAGELLAEIDTPEVDQQLQQAQADLATAEANETLARSTAQRWQTLLKTESVSKQDADEKAGDYAAKKALTESARANLRRLRDLQNFQRVVAPFDGVITARRTDVGQLITAGGGNELFHIADTRKLRIYVQVPQPYAPYTKAGVNAELRFAERPSRSYPATIVRTADALDPGTRTLLVQLEEDNANGELFPGAYAEVHFKLPLAAQSLRIPANALLFRREGMLAATVNADNRVTLKPLTIGRDFGTELEVVAGIAPNEKVIINPPDSLTEGAAVRVAPPAPAAQASADGKKQ